MKVCLLSEPQSFHTEKWISYLKKRGHQIYLVSLTPHSCNVTGIETFFVGNNNDFLEKIDYLLAVKKLKRLLVQLEPDILHAHYVTKWGWLAALSGFKPFLLTPWGSDLFIDIKKSIYHRYLSKFSIKKADLITTNSSRLKTITLKLGAESDKIHKIHFGLDLNLFKRRNPEESKQRLKIPANFGVVFSPRLMQPVYNIITLVNTIPRVLSIDSQVIFILINYPQNKYSKAVNDLIMRLKIEDNVLLLDKIPNNEMPLYYNAAEITLSIPLSDSAPVSLFEAMACGSIPITSDLPSLREIIVDQESGFLASPLDAPTIAERIIEVLRNYESYSEMRQNNIKFVKKNADQTFWMSKMEKLYDQLLAQNYAK